MKLKNKLIPLIGVTAVCATVAPISLTSCTANPNAFIDLTKRYVPTQGMYTGRDVFANIFDAMEVYATQTAANPQIFVDDYLWSSSYGIDLIQQSIKDKINNNKPIEHLGGEKNNQEKTVYEGEVLYHNIKMSNVEVEAATMSTASGAIQATVPCVSFTCEYEYKYDYSRFDDQKRFAKTDSDADKTKNSADKGTITVKHLPFQLAWASQDKVWWVQPASALLMGSELAWNLEQHPWNISIYNERKSTMSSSDSPMGGDITYDIDLVTDITVNWDDEDVQEYCEAYQEWVESGYSGDEPVPSDRVLLTVESLRDFAFISYYFWPVGLNNK